MNRNEVIERLGAQRDRLKALGVESLALFGSTARNESLDSSDIDLLVTFNRPISLFDYADIETCIAQIVGNKRIDLVHRDSVLSELKEEIFSESIACL